MRTEREANLHKTMGCVRIYQGRMDGSGTVDMTGHVRSGLRRRTGAPSGTVGRVVQRYRQGPLPSKHLSLKTFSGHLRSRVRTIRHEAQVPATIVALISPHSGRSKDQATPHRTGCGKPRRLLAHQRSSTVFSVRGEPCDTPTIRLQPGLAVGLVEGPGECSVVCSAHNMVKPAGARE